MKNTQAEQQLLSQKLITMPMVYGLEWRWQIRGNTKLMQKHWVELDSSQDALLVFIQDETQIPQSRGKALWLLDQLHKYSEKGYINLKIDYPHIADAQLLLRLFLQLFETDSNFQAWEHLYSDLVITLGDAAIPYFYKHLDNHWLAPHGLNTGCEKLWMEPYFAYGYRYADYAARCLSAIANIPIADYNLYVTYEQRVQPLAVFRQQIQDYCAQRGIHLPNESSILHSREQVLPLMAAMKDKDASAHVDTPWGEPYQPFPYCTTRFGQLYGATDNNEALFLQIFSNESLDLNLRLKAWLILREHSHFQFDTKMLVEIVQQQFLSAKIGNPWAGCCGGFRFTKFSLDEHALGLLATEQNLAPYLAPFFFQHLDNQTLFPKFVLDEQIPRKDEISPDEIVAYINELKLKYKHVAALYLARVFWLFRGRTISNFPWRVENVINELNFDDFKLRVRATASERGIILE